MNDDYGYGAVAAAYLATVFIFLLFAIAIYVVSAIFYNKLFAKAGVEGKWRGWVPVYRELVFGKLGDVSPWAFLIAYGVVLLLSWIPVLGQVLALAVLAVLVMAAYRVGLKLQKSPALLLLWLIPGVGFLIWLGIVAYDKSRWNPNVAPSPWAGNFLADKTVWAGIPVQPSAAAGPSYGSVPPPGAYPPAPSGYAPPPPSGYTPPPPAGYAPPPSGATPPPPPSTQPPSSNEPPRV